ncbi:DMT family transporter [Amycolatopsis australiensis]|uniref:Permease of the drug/metabolite transporter (DMT) superfamily n=1 Tax=Amycolatopsis australiensis TaxID=546364 RepID=A0A1K1SR53_9PSEU|nr:DMT family transporter [Amycolatopsis australiensis]SFW86803.1 Permease of the drug/metabolite transporter (DMT) superfamily [Amycolatopsis australiensis]
MRSEAVAGAGFVLMWSSGFIGATLGTRYAAAETLLMWRFLFAAGLLGGWWLLTRRRRFSVQELVVHAALGVLSQGAYLAGTVWSVQLGVPAGTVALIAALQPILAAALAHVLLGDRAARRQWAGLVLGLGGVALVVGGDLAGGSGAAPSAYLLPFAAMLALVGASFLERSAPEGSSLADTLMIQCAVSAVLFTGVALGTGHAAPSASGPFWFAVAWVVVLSTFGGYGCYWLVLRRGSVTRVSTLLYLTPPTTMLFAFLLFGQRIDLLGLLGLAVCAAAVALVLAPRNRPPGSKSGPGKHSPSRRQVDARE